MKVVISGYHKIELVEVVGGKGQWLEHELERERAETKYFLTMLPPWRGSTSPRRWRVLDPRGFGDVRMQGESEQARERRLPSA